MNMLLGFCNVRVTEKRSKKSYHIRGQFPRGLRPYYNNSDIKNHVFLPPNITCLTNTLIGSLDQGVELHVHSHSQ